MAGLAGDGSEPEAAPGSFYLHAVMTVSSVRLPRTQPCKKKGIKTHTQKRGSCSLGTDFSRQEVTGRK